MPEPERVDYRGRGAVITGGASGIGLAMAEELARRGANIVIADIEDSALAAARDQIEKLGSGKVRSFRCDVAEEASVRGLCDFSFDELGKIHLLFNNAGVGVSGTFATLSRADWDWVMGVNLWGCVHGAQAFLPRMLEQGEPGHILFNSSFSGLVHDAGLSPYCASKAAVVALAEVLKLELRATPIGVSVVCPMRVDTEIGHSSRNRDAADRSGSAAQDVTDPRDERVPGSILTAQEAVLRILDGVDHRELYIMTHGEGRPFLAKRFQRIDKIYARQHPESAC